MSGRSDRFAFGLGAFHWIINLEKYEIECETTKGYETTKLKYQK